MPSPLNTVLFNWAALVALCALPYLKLRHHLGLDTTDALQWSLLAIGVAGTVGILHSAWQTSRVRASRAAHGLPASRRN